MSADDYAEVTQQAPSLLSPPESWLHKGTLFKHHERLFNTLVPIHQPSIEEELEALSILRMDASDIRCAYCGDKSTEWDHLRPIITGQKPTGYITEIANLVPACGKCNQSKGKQAWHIWMCSKAPLSPASRGIIDLDQRFERLKLYENWREPVKIEFESIIDPEVWSQHVDNWRRVLNLMDESQRYAAEIKNQIESAMRNAAQVYGER